MLRTYTPINHPIRTLHNMLQHLVCEVWCKACEENSCDDLLNSDFKTLCDQLDWLKTRTEEIYQLCKALSTEERQLIIDAFNQNNRIEELCNGNFPPLELSTLPSVVQNEMKELLEDFYKRLLNISKVPCEKLDYYNLLVKNNKFKTCPICGLSDIETEDSPYIEDYDHFFPKAHYPFAAVNFNNLVPTCDKCNKKHKGSKKPLDHNGKVYYPFEAGREEINVLINFDQIDFDDEKRFSETVMFTFSGDETKNSTWNWLYNIEERYAQIYRRDMFSWLRALKNDIEFSGKTIEEVIDNKIKSYTEDRFDEKKFLKIALLEEVKNKPEWMRVYSGEL